MASRASTNPITAISLRALESTIITRQSPQVFSEIISNGVLHILRLDVLRNSGQMLAEYPVHTGFSMFRVPPEEHYWRILADNLRQSLGVEEDSELQSSQNLLICSLQVDNVVRG